MFLFGINYKLIRFSRLIKLSMFIFPVVLLLATGPADAKATGAGKIIADKIVVLIIDDLGIDDLRNNELINLDKIANSGIVGLMNTRTKSLSSQNRTAAYLTIGTGVRVQALQSQREIEVLKEVLKKQTPGHTPGKIGEAANKYGKRVALLGNSDSNLRQNFALLIAMDRKGLVDDGKTDGNLLISDKGTPWGFRTDSKRLISSLNTAIQNNDIIFADFGDTTRVAEARERSGLKGKTLEQARNQAFQRVDAFLGELIKIVNKQSALLVVISPTSPADTSFTGIKNLSPVVIYQNGISKGILTSNTTRRTGLVSNIDIAPGIFDFLGVDTSSMQFAGEKITVVTNSNPLKTIETNYTNYAGLKTFRYIVHAYYVLLIALVFKLNIFPAIKNRQMRNKRLSRAVSVMVIALPVVSSVTAVLLQNIAAVFIVFNILLLITGYVFSASGKTSMSAMTHLSLATSGLIIFDLLTGFDYLINTPLGFNDVFTGGRYYGINNDCMGILLGSLFFGLFSFFERSVLSHFGKIIITAIVSLLAVLSQTPGFGANVGGTIAAITTGTLACIVLVTKRQITVINLLLITIIALIAEFSISFMDTLSASRTHAGKIAAKLFNDNFTEHFIEIIGSKLSVFLAMLVLPPWNILFFGQIYFYHTVLQRYAGEIKKIEGHRPLILRSFEVIMYGATATFVFNDTGIIAAAMMLIYLTVPFGMLLVREVSDINEYGEAVTQRI